MKDRANNGIGAGGYAEQWEAINWSLAEKRVRNLRQRIYRATQQQQWNKVRSLMKLMLRNRSNLLLAVRRVTQENPGRKTAGTDRQLVLSAAKRMKLVNEMEGHEFWLARPARRVYIPKASGKRPLGIPTIKNRCAQAVVKNALEPSWEARFEANSYGFRPGRGAHDAIQQAWIRLNRQGRDKWVLDADIKGAFDNIDHDYILRALQFSPGRALIKQWLKAGYVENDLLHSTDSGVPQGSVIGPLIANIALDGMESLLSPKYGFVRYCDDFIITARTREMIETIKPTIERWLAERGLTMHSEKTRIVSVEDGFNFLGFTIKHHSGKCLVEPQRDKVLAFLKDLRIWLKQQKETRPEYVIRHLNPRLKGWANFYRHACSKETFVYVDHQVWKMLWNWAQRRHPRKGKRWVQAKYFGDQNGRSWRFRASVQLEGGARKTFFVTDVAGIRITRHVKVRGTASPDDPTMTDYWNERNSRRRSIRMSSKPATALSYEGLS